MVVNQPVNLLLLHTRKKKNEGDLLREPTYEPTYGAQTGEPTTFTGLSGEPTVYGQTGEPTVYGQSGEPTVYGQSGEPTVYGQSGEPTVYGQSGEPTVFTGKMHTAEPTIFMHDTLGSHDKEPTGEPTIFGMHGDEGPKVYCSGTVKCDGWAFCNYDESDHGFCESCHDFESSTSCFTDGLPHKGAQDCKDVCFHGQSTDSSKSGTSTDTDSGKNGTPVSEPSQPPHVRTWAPTTEGQFDPTSDPTIFPTPEPTNAI